MKDGIKVVIDAEIVDGCLYRVKRICELGNRFVAVSINTSNVDLQPLED